MSTQSSFLPMVWGHHRLTWGRRTYVMGIVNMTPDSFSGDGLYAREGSTEQISERVIAQVQQYVADGATLIDFGGESTRPTAASITAEEEIARVVPLIRAVRAAVPPEILLSIDTYKAAVAEQALAAGADLINDIWGLTHDPAMVSVAAAHGVPVILMANMRGYRKHDIMSDVLRFLSDAIDRALAGGIAWDHIVVDPGIGFGTTLEENLLILRRLGELRVLGRPILLGTSRKSHIGKVLGDVPVTERLEGSLATVALGIAQGADIVRVHDVREAVRVARMSDAVMRGNFSAPAPLV